jgi:hypothetical protein
MQQQQQQDHNKKLGTVYSLCLCLSVSLGVVLCLSLSISGRSWKSKEELEELENTAMAISLRAF